MQPYRVLLQRAVSQEAAIDVPARTREEAEEIARQRARDGMVAWTETHNDTEVFAEQEEN
jgi:hypothetical protein